MIAIDDKPAKVYVGDMQPVNIYKGNTKLAGWHPQTVSGEGTISLDGAYNVPPDALVIDGKCEQTVGVWGTNLVTNGDFSNGTAGWGGINGDSIAADNGTLKIYGNTGNQHKWCMQSNKNIPVGHKVYVRGSVKTDSAAAIMQGRLTLLTSSFAAAAQNTIITLSTNVWGTVSGVVETTAEVSIIVLGATFETQDIAIAANAWVDNILVIDLTAAFGAGNEPTAEQMDAYLAAYPNSWFNGSALLTTSGTPNSPSPTYPAPITAITGDITITGANGAATDVVTAALGTVELCSLPDGTKDTYDAVTGVVTKRVGEVVFDGSVDENIDLYTAHPVAGMGKFVLRPDNLGTIYGSDRVNYRCDRFKWSPNYNYTSDTSTDTTIEVNSTYITFMLVTSVATTTAALRAWLAANPVTVYYKLAEPYTRYNSPLTYLLWSGRESRRSQ